MTDPRPNPTDAIRGCLEFVWVLTLSFAIVALWVSTLRNSAAIKTTQGIVLLNQERLANVEDVLRQDGFPRMPTTFISTDAPDASGEPEGIYGVDRVYQHELGTWTARESGEITWHPFTEGTPEPPRPWTDDDIRNPVEPGSYGAIGDNVRRWVKHEPRKPWFPNRPTPIKDVKEAGASFAKGAMWLGLSCVLVIAGLLALPIVLFVCRKSQPIVVYREGKP